MSRERKRRGVFTTKQLLILKIQVGMIFLIQQRYQTTQEQECYE
jgi:hypothetical protein